MSLENVRVLRFAKWAESFDLDANVGRYIFSEGSLEFPETKNSLSVIFRCKTCSNSSTFNCAISYGRGEPLSGRVCRGLEPSMRRRKEVLVHVYAGAAAGVVEVLPGLSKYPNIERACRHYNTSLSMGV